MGRSCSISAKPGTRSHPDGARGRAVGEGEGFRRSREPSPLGGRRTPFDATVSRHHLFDPRSGTSAATYAWITVEAPTATEADAWSTAFSLMPMADIRKTLASTAIRRVRLRENEKTPVITL